MGVELAALVIALLSLVVAVISWRRTEIYQSYDYSVRLELMEGNVNFSIGREPAFHCKPVIRNVGNFPVRIEEINMDLGLKGDARKRWSSQVGYRFDLRAGEAVDFEFEATREEVAALRKTFGIADEAEVEVAMRIVYHTPARKKTEVLRTMGLFSPGGQVVIPVTNQKALT